MPASSMTQANDAFGVRPASHRLEKLPVAAVTFVASVLGLGYLVFNLYALNKGFSVWDEAYYLLSYKMAAEGFYRHFNNTPFIVAFLFENFKPGLIGYRAIHLALNFFGAGFFTYSVIRYVESSGFSINNRLRILLWSLAFVGSMYVYYISVATLSYNHLNEYLVLTSQSFILLALARERDGRGRTFFLLLAGIVLALDLYIKPTTFLSALLAEVVFLLFFLPNIKTGLRAVAAVATGCFVCLSLSLVLFYPPTQWMEYLSLMSSQQAHSPMKVISGFLSSAFDMLRSGGWLIVCGLVVSALTIYAPKRNAQARPINYFSGIIIACLLLANVYVAIRFFFPADIWTSFSAHWWYWWVYSSTTLLIITIVNFALGLIICSRQGLSKSKPILLLLLLLASNPVAMSVGTLNGFGQVQIHATSWLILSGLVLIFSSATASMVTRIYSSILILVFMLVSVFYFYRQQMPLNFAGQGAIYEQKNRLVDLPLLHNILVDKPTYDFLMSIKSILDKHPNIPTVAFFDMPGMQYAFGRPWAILDPWLTNYEQPMTKDNDYNCNAITSHPDRVKNTIFIVSREKHIDAELRNCLATIGFPERMEFLGEVHTGVGSSDEPVKVYLNP